MTMSQSKVASLTLEGYVQMSVSHTAYRNELWPKLEKVIDLILQANEEQSRLISFEENYSTVYMIVCNGHGRLLYEDLLHKKIDVFIDSLNESLYLQKDRNLKEYIERFAAVLQHFDKVIHSLLSIFVYLSRCVLEGELEQLVYARLNERLVRVHIDCVLDHLNGAGAQPFAVEPSTYSYIIKTVYQLDEDYARKSPDTFRRFIPGYMASTRVGQLQQLSEEAKHMCRNLNSVLSRQSQSSYKRKLEEDAQGEMDAC